MVIIIIRTTTNDEKVILKIIIITRTRKKKILKKSFCNSPEVGKRALFKLIFMIRVSMKINHYEKEQRLEKGLFVCLFSFTSKKAMIVHRSIDRWIDHSKKNFFFTPFFLVFLLSLLLSYSNIRKNVCSLPFFALNKRHHTNVSTKKKKIFLIIMSRIKNFNKFNFTGNRKKKKWEN